jgi:hypothetical protein
VFVKTQKASSGAEGKISSGECDLYMNMWWSVVVIVV